MRTIFKVLIIVGVVGAVGYGGLLAASTIVNLTNRNSEESLDISGYTTLSTAEDLLQIQNGGDYKLDSDIDCGGAKWRCLSIEGDLRIYGQGHAIKNIEFTNNNNGSTFGLISNSDYDVTFDKLAITDFTMDIDYERENGSFVGPFVAYSNHGVEFNECYSEGTIKTNVYNSSHYGGFVGYNSSGSDFTNCLTNVSFEASIESGDDREITFGGFAGKTGVGSEFINCVSTCTMDFDTVEILSALLDYPSLYMGGFAGKANDSYYNNSGYYSASGLSAPIHIKMSDALAEETHYLDSFFAAYSKRGTISGYFCANYGSATQARIDELDELISSSSTSSEDKASYQAERETLLKEMEESSYYYPSMKGAYGIGLNINRSEFFSEALYNGDYTGTDLDGEYYDVFLAFDFEDVWRFDGRPHLRCFE